MENSWNAINKLRGWSSFDIVYVLLLILKVKKNLQITETKLYVPVETLSTQDSARLLQQLKSGFKRIINWSKYESDIQTYAQNRYLNHLINTSFQGEQTFCIIFWKWRSEKITLKLLYSKSRNKRIKCYDW